MKLIDFDRPVRDLVRRTMYTDYRQGTLREELAENVCQILLDNTELPATECSDSAYGIVDEYIAGAEAAEAINWHWETSG